MAKRLFLYSCFFIFAFAPVNQLLCQVITIKNDLNAKTISFGNAKMQLTIDYNKKAIVSRFLVNGQQVINGTDGLYSGIRTKEANYSTRQLLASPVVKITGNNISVAGIVYGDKAKDITVMENWLFNIGTKNIKFHIDRNVSKTIVAEQVAFPAFVFKDTAVWEGAYQDYGGLAWFYLFNKRQDTYGVHSSQSEFWNSKTGNGLAISADAPSNHVAMDYSRTNEDKLAFTISIAPKEILPRFDSGTNRRRFVRDTNAVWASFTIPAGKTTQSVTIAYFDCSEKVNRGHLVGVNQKEVSDVLSTIARIGVIDKQHFGGNSWHTPYGPICLHEQYIAQIGLAINDKNYLKGYQDCLDFYRDNAIKPDGRVFARWAYTNEDMMPDEVNDKGFYEAQWGYLLDANPDFVSNVAELYDQTGNLSWVKTQQAACEKALDWILKRDSNNNGLVEMITDNHNQRKGSDWIDIIWASYENAFVNAKLYHALILWAGIEKQLGNTPKERYYAQFAQRLKSTFNKPVTEGGLWDAEKQCYVHWREKDGSIHGNNMVTPVNFMAIAYDICDDEARKKSILDAIEVQMQKENLFFWPLCLYSYAPGEGNDWQFPFPNYENGDIFLSWGSVAIKAYAAYKPDLAIKYINNVLAQYAKDGLAFQRYGRAKQDGLGDDILSGNSLAIIGLYQSVYGINPLYNRFYLDPHITPALAGTSIKYNYREQPLEIGLNTNSYSLTGKQFTVISKSDFGFFSSKNELQYFNGSTDTASMAIKTTTTARLVIDIKNWNTEKLSWTQSSKSLQANKLSYRINSLTPNENYNIVLNDKLLKQVRSRVDGSLQFEYGTSKGLDVIEVLHK